MTLSLAFVLGMIHAGAVSLAIRLLDGQLRASLANAERRRNRKLFRAPERFGARMFGRRSGDARLMRMLDGVEESDRIARSVIASPTPRPGRKS